MYVNYAGPVSTGRGPPASYPEAPTAARALAGTDVARPPSWRYTHIRITQHNGPTGHRSSVHKQNVKGVYVFGMRRRRFGGSVLLSMAVPIFLLLALALGGCGSASGADSTDAQGPDVPGENVADEDVPGETVSITDQVGRVVEVPVPIDTVFCTSPMGTNLLYTLAPEVLVGWNITPTALEKEFIPEKYRQVVGLGGWFGKNTTGNVEEIIKRDPDLILDFGSLDQADISEADRIQGLVNISVVVVDGGLTESGESLRYIGRLLGVDERAEQLAAYFSDAVLAEAQANTARLADADRIRVYYAEGPKA